MTRSLSSGSLDALVDVLLRVAERLRREREADRTKAAPG
jgi:hypothetical protein